MNNFKQTGPGGLKGRQEYFGGRPASDAEYGKKKKFDKKPNFGGKGGFKSGDRGGFGGNRGGFSGGRDTDRREVTMHKATCSTCGKACEVPFRPDGSKPVLCSECFGKNRSDDRNGVDRRTDRPRRDFDTPRKEAAPNQDITALKAQVATLEAKVDQILSLLKAAPVAKTEDVVMVKKTVAKKAVTKKAVAKKVTAKKVAKKVTKKKK